MPPKKLTGGQGAVLLKAKSKAKAKASPSKTSSSKKGKPATPFLAQSRPGSAGGRASALARRAREALAKGSTKSLKKKGNKQGRTAEELKLALALPGHSGGDSHGWRGSGGAGAKGKGSKKKKKQLKPKAKGKSAPKRKHVEEDEEAENQTKSNPSESRAEREERKRRREEALNWFAGKNKELLLRCFEKELALTLKIFFTDPDVLSRRKSSYFRRNYFDCPGLKKDCEAVLEYINQMAAPRVKEATAKTSKNEVKQSLLEAHMLKLEETRGFMRLSWPSFWGSLGDRVDYRWGFLGKTGKFGSGTAGAIRAALADWWYEDIYAWVVTAEQKISNSQMSRYLFDGKDDHLELKISGMGGRTGSIVLSEIDGLEVLPQLVDERLRGNTTLTAWTFRIIDGVRLARAEVLLKRVLEMGADEGSQAKIPDAKKDFLKKVQETAARDGGDVKWLNRLIELKAEMGLIPESEASALAHERNLCLPYARVASSTGDTSGNDWAESLPMPALMGSLPSPEDEPLLAHGDSSRPSMELEFHDSGDEPCVCRVEVVARVPPSWKRPYGIHWKIQDEEPSPHS
uniref:Uncharacterized protein n=1 Tax=Alexandrium monilatum TaxID=311494 RepID=A0A7S4UUI4_9DINO